MLFPPRTARGCIPRCGYQRQRPRGPRRPCLCGWLKTEYAGHLLVLGRRLRADGATELTGFGRIFTRPTEAQLRELKRRQRNEAEYARGVKRARKAKEGEG
eukprot:3722064-Prymnesium_polylepis.1